MAIGHIDGEFRVVDIQPIILAPDEAPVEAVFGGVGFERIELIIDLRIDIFVLVLGFTARVGTFYFSVYSLGYSLLMSLFIVPRCASSNPNTLGAIIFPLFYSRYCAHSLNMFFELVTEPPYLLAALVKPNIAPSLTIASLNLFEMDEPALAKSSILS